MTKLHQLIALRDGVQSRSHKALSELHKLAQKHNLFDGLSRTYAPDDVEGEKLPSESTLVQVRAAQMLAALRDSESQRWDLIASQDRTNQEARANVVVMVGGREETILQDVPATHLLFLEKELDNVRTFISKLPTIDPAKPWMFDEALGLQKTAPVESVRNKKVLRNHVKYEATDRHPAQVDTWFEDIRAGLWTKVEFSGALTAVQQRDLLVRVNVLSDAVKSARQIANDTQTVNLEVAKPLFDFILGA